MKEYTKNKDFLIMSKDLEFEITQIMVRMREYNIIFLNLEGLK